MATNDDSFGKFNNTPTDSSDLNNSIVKKVTSLIPASITRWFGKSKAVQRRRDSESDDDSYAELEQPPSKRIRHVTEYTDSYSYQNGSPPKLTPRPSINTDFFNNIRARPPVRSTNNFNRLEKSNVDITVNETRRSYSSLYDDPMPSTSGIQNSNYRYNFPSPSPIRETTTLLNNEKRTDSGESTSGCSSMAQRNPIVPAGNEDVGRSSINDKPESDRSVATTASSKRLKTDSLDVSTSRLSGSILGDRPRVKSASLASRRPSFNTSSFGSTRLIDRTLSTERITGSPFYSGLTMFGGASAYRKQPPPHTVNRSPSHGIGLIKSVQIKPSNDAAMNKSSSTSLSLTARRILDTLEHFNSPLSEARKIPRLNIQTKSSVSSLSISPYARPSRGSATDELAVPTVPEILQMKKREQMQSNTEKMRNTAAQSKSTLNDEVEYRCSNTEATDVRAKHSNKMKTKINKVRPSKNDIIHEETVEEVNLPNVVLPITTLPKFDLLPIKSTPSVTLSSYTSPLLSLKPTTSTTSSPSIPTTVIEKPLITPATSSSNKYSFNFAAPIELSKSTKSLMSINNFKFSKPMSVNGGDESLTFKSSSYNNDPAATLKRKSPKTNGDIDGIIKPVSAAAPIVMKTSGSVMDVLSKKSNDDFMAKFKPSTDTWECSSCLIRNKQDQDKCLACATAKTSSGVSSVSKSTPSVSCSNTAVSSSSFGSQFKMPNDKWECSVCMVRNNAADERCVACTSAKPGSSSTDIKPPANSIGFGDKFKPPSGSWTCSVCMIQNKDDTSKCAACETARPGVSSAETKSTGGFGGSFTKKSSEWECPSCMVRNPTNRLKCVCCDAPQPGSTTAPPAAPSGGITLEPTTQFKFGIDKANTQEAASTSSTTTTSSSTGFVFGNKSTTTPSTTSSSGFTFDSKPSNSTGFTFGIPPSKTAEKSPEKRKLYDDTDSIVKPVVEEKPTKSNVEVVPTSSPPKFNFEAPKKINSTVTSTSSGFTFSATPQVSVAASSSEGLFMFGSPKTMNSSQPGTSTFTMASPTQSTSFTSNTATEVKSDIKSTPEKPMFKMPTTSNPFGGSTSTSLFGGDVSKSTMSSPFAKDINGTTTTAPSTFSSNIVFGSPATTTTAATLSFNATTTTSSTTFGVPIKPTTSLSSAPPFGSQTGETVAPAFGAATPTNNVFDAWKSTPFGSAPANNNSTSSNMFGNGNSTAPQFGMGAASSGSTFGAAATNTPSFGMTSATTTPAVFGSSTSLTPAFGSTSSAAAPTFGTANNTFGGSAAPEFGKTNAAISFGGNSTSAAPIFGSSSSAPAAVFGAAASNVSMSTNAFAFGAKVEEKKPAITFGVGNDSNAVAKPPGFSFNATPSTANGGFNFKAVCGTPAFGAASSAASNAFGAVNNTATGFGAPAGNVPTFGSPTVTPAAPPAFMFGQSQQQQQPSSLFTFGSSNSDVKPANTNGPFTFGGVASQNPTAAVPQFDPNVKPTFHFSDGAPTTFTAQGAGGAAPRRFKKAVRRTTPRI